MFVCFEQECVDVVEVLLMCMLYWCDVFVVGQVWVGVFVEQELYGFFVFVVVIVQGYGFDQCGQFQVVGGIGWYVCFYEFVDYFYVVMVCSWDECGVVVSVGGVQVGIV